MNLLGLITLIFLNITIILGSFYATTSAYKEYLKERGELVATIIEPDSVNGEINFMFHGQRKTFTHKDFMKLIGIEIADVK